MVSKYVPPSSVSEVIVRHPQPPERTGGTADSQGTHLLTNNFFLSLHGILRPGGTITILSDNFPYTKSLAEIIAATNQFSCDDVIAEEEGSRVEELVGTVAIWRSRGGDGEGDGVAAEGGSSYFSRLWDRGQKKRRWVIRVMRI